MVVIGVIATAIAIPIALIIPWFPAKGSIQAGNVRTLYDVLIIATVPIFVLVETVVLFAVRDFRVRPGQEHLDGPPIHGNTRLEVFWTALPAALLLGLLSYSFVVLDENEKKPAHEITIGVTGQQFAWSFQYPPSVTGGRPVESDQLFLPKGESVQFKIHSKDVIHAFWVPAFRLQIDAVPGITTSYRATPDRLGTYPVVCNLLCGLGHALMRTNVKVVQPARFQAWLKSRQGVSTTAAPGKASE